MPQQSFQEFGALRRFARRGESDERCELCGSAVAAEHEHLVEPGKRRLICSCQACAILFSGQVGQRYRRVPTRVRSLPGFRLTDAQWDSLLVPINMAFFFANSATGRITAVYPSPAGATESLLTLENWEQIALPNAEVRSMQPDVEALLVNRLGAARGFPANRYFLVPIDQCFKLVGLVRMHWRGLSGGEELWREVADYFAALAARAVLAGEQHYA
ncbi:MAG: DUF5947 family protein [Candidatus Sulfopaludibacter sp.]|nr:DUF5947 family protein [Candidatus Sulfopaludibacter sp.]